MILDELLPMGQLKARFPDLRVSEISGVEQMRLLERDHPNKLIGLALHQWDRIVAFGPVAVKPMALKKWIANEDPRLCERISTIIGQALVQDIVYADVTVRRGAEDLTVAEIMVAHLYPGDLHLADIQLSNPDQPIPDVDRYKYQEYRGLGLFGQVIDSLLEVARRRHCRAVTLTAASAELMQFFTRHGFAISNTNGGKWARAAGQSYPMERTLTTI